MQVHRCPVRPRGPIRPQNGVQREIAKKIKRNHERAFELWASGITEAQFIASLTADPARFTSLMATDFLVHIGETSSTALAWLLA